MSTNNICFYKGVDKSKRAIIEFYKEVDKSIRLKTRKFLDCVLIGVSAVITSNLLCYIPWRRLCLGLGIRYSLPR